MERIAFGIYLLVLVISPLLFGAVHAYAYSLVFILILAASLLLVVHNIHKDYKSGSLYFLFPKTGLNFVFFSVFALLVIQVLPQPSSLMSLLSPNALDVQAGVADLTGKDRSMALAAYIYPVRMSLIRWTVYGLFFIGLSQVLNSRKRIETLCFCVLITAGFISVYGIYQAYAGDNRIWWFAGYGGDVRGTFINRNHFAGMMAMALMLATAYASSLRSSFYQQTEGQPPDAKDSVRRFLSAEQMHSKRVLVVFCGVLIGLGLVLSASRGAIISAASGLLVMGLLYLNRRSQRKNGVIVLVIFLLIGGYGLQVGLEHTFERFQTEQLQSSLEGRFRYAQKTIDLFKDYQLTGVGTGNFQHAYPRYQSPEDMGFLIDYAHNDWAQLLAETGLAGFILTFTGIGYFVFFIVRQWLTRKEHKAVALGIVPLAVLTTMGIHSLFDFNMHIPANVFTLGAIIAIGQGALFIKVRKSGERFELGFHRLAWGSGGNIVFIVLLVVIGWTMSWTVRHFTAEIYCSSMANSTLIRDRNPSFAEVQKAIAWDRYNAEYWYKLAKAQRREKSGEAGLLDKMTGSLEKAVLLNPYNAIYYLELGLAHTQRWQEPDFTDKWLNKADQAMEFAGIYSGARDPMLHKDLAVYLLKRSKTLDPVSSSWDMAVEKVIFHYKQAHDLLKGKKQDDLFEDIRKTVWNYYPDAEIFEKIVGEEGLGMEQEEE